MSTTVPTLAPGGANLYEWRERLRRHIQSHVDSTAHFHVQLRDIFTGPQPAGQSL